MIFNVPKSHPRYESLMLRHKIIDGAKSGVVADAGVIAHGRGESFDYLVGEKTNDFALSAIEAAATLFLLSSHPIISVNGNLAALCPKECKKLSEVANAPLEINLFYRTKEREQAILDALKAVGVDEKSVLGIGDKDFKEIEELEHARRIVDPDGIYIADTVFVPLEDGDRTEALVKLGKKVITVDLNPLSRTAKMSTITIVDNIVRVMPLLVKKVEEFSKLSKDDLKAILSSYNNEQILKDSKKFIADFLIDN